MTAEKAQVTIPAMGFWRLILSDYRAHHRDRPESKLRAAFLFIPRFLYNPSLQLALLVRVAQRGPSLIRLPIRWLQVVMFSSEIYWFHGDDAIQIGPGINFPHATNIFVNPGVRIGSGVTIYHNTQFGTERHWVKGDPVDRCPVLGDRSIVYSYAMVQGPYTIGHGSVVGINVVLDADVPPGALRTVKALKPAGDWDRSAIDRTEPALSALPKRT